MPEEEGHSDRYDLALLRRAVCNVWNLEQQDYRRVGIAGESIGSMIERRSNHRVNGDNILIS
jgi:hypothetical protein